MPPSEASRVYVRPYAQYICVALHQIPVNKAVCKDYLKDTQADNAIFSYMLLFL